MIKIENFKNFLLLLLVSLVFTSPILLSGNNLGIQDWDMHFAYLESARKIILEFKQFPFWNPYLCGGIPAFGHPESSIFSLTFIFVLIFQTVYGVKISIFLHWFIGMLGFYLLATDILKAKSKAALFGSILFTLNSSVSSAIGVGMLPFLYFFYIPLILWSFIKGIQENKNKYFILTLLFLSLEIYSNYQIFVIFIPSFLLIGLFLSLIKKKYKPFVVSVLILIFTVIICLPKLILAFDFVNQHPRKIKDLNSGYTTKGFFYFLLSKNQPYHLTPSIFNMNYGVDEASLYVGLIPVIFFFLGLLKSAKTHKNKQLKYLFVILLIVNFSLMMGDHFFINLWRFIKKFPIYDQFRVAQRFRFNFILFFSLISTLGWDYYFRKLKKFNLAKIFEFSLLIFIFLSLFLFSYTNFFSHAFIIKNKNYLIDFEKNKNTSKTPYRNYSNIDINYQYVDKKFDSLLIFDSVYLPWSSHFFAIKSGVGITNCYISSPIHSKVSPINKKNYYGEVYLINRRGSLKIVNWSPNKILIKINNLLDEDRLVINQNYDPHWYFRLKNSLMRSENFNGLNSLKINKKKLDKESIILFEYLPFNFSLSLK
jgi:hypothetical protein